MKRGEEVAYGGILGDVDSAVNPGAVVVDFERAFRDAEVNELGVVVDSGVSFGISEGSSPGDGNIIVCNSRSGAKEKVSEGAAEGNELVSGGGEGTVVEGNGNTFVLQIIKYVIHGVDGGEGLREGGVTDFDIQNKIALIAGNIA